MNELNYPIKKIIYTGENKRDISIPLGGIGTGCIRLESNGALTGFDSLNMTDNKSGKCFSFFAVKAEKDGEMCDARLLQTDSDITYSFLESDFVVSTPFSEIDFFHDKFPGKIYLTAWNPLIPLNDTDSSIPAALMEYEVENTSNETIKYTFYGVLRNPFDYSINSFSDSRNDKIKYIKLSSSKENLKRYEQGEMCIGVYGDNIRYIEHLCRDSKQDIISDFVEEILRGDLDNRIYEPEKDISNTAVISTEFTLNPGEKNKVRFLISWYMPYTMNIMNFDNTDTENYENNIIKNYYSRYFTGADECAYYCLSQWERLFEETDVLRQVLYSSTLPVKILEAVSASITALKTPLNVRGYDGSLCYVPDRDSEKASDFEYFSYAYIIPYLFPNLERSIIANHYRSDVYRISTLENRVNIKSQLYDILRVYGEFKLCGNLQWLSSVWYDIIDSIEFITESDTLVSELYAAVLKASLEMADILKDKKHAEKFSILYEKCKEALKSGNVCAENSHENKLFHLYTDITGLADVLDFEKKYEVTVGNLLNDTKNEFDNAATSVNYSLLGISCGQKIDAYNKSYKFCPNMNFAQRGVFRGVVCFDNFFGFIERGIDYIQLKCIKGSIKIRQIEVPDIPLKVKCGGFEIGFSKDRNKAILDNDCEVNSTRDMLVIFRIN